MSAPVALVYRGPAARPSACSDAVVSLLRSSSLGFDVRYVGPQGELPLNAKTLASAALYAQPGGGELGPAYRRMRQHRSAIRDYVAGGGHYLGFCLGGYLAGATPGFGLLPGDTDQYVGSKGATVRTMDDTLVEVLWRGRPRRMFFQDGPIFLLDSDAGTTVLARYRNSRDRRRGGAFRSGSGRCGRAASGGNRRLVQRLRAARRSTTSTSGTTSWKR